MLGHLRPVGHGLDTSARNQEQHDMYYLYSVLYGRFVASEVRQKRTREWNRRYLCPPKKQVDSCPCMKRALGGVKSTIKNLQQHCVAKQWHLTTQKGSLGTSAKLRHLEIARTKKELSAMR